MRSSNGTQAATTNHGAIERVWPGTMTGTLSPAPTAARTAAAVASGSDSSSTLPAPVSRASSSTGASAKRVGR